MTYGLSILAFENLQLSVILFCLSTEFIIVKKPVCLMDFGIHRQQHVKFPFIVLINVFHLLLLVGCVLKQSLSFPACMDS